jgi:type IV secretory pathway protease TraF
MVPTLLGENCPARCVRCKRIVRVSPLIDGVLERHRLCGICGGLLQEISHQETSQPRSSDAGAMQGGASDVVSVSPLDKAQRSQLKIGDVVAIDYQGTLRVKRIAALRGDVITVPRRRVCVNDMRLEDRIVSSVDANELLPARLRVDQDDRQSKTRWVAYNPESAWERSEERQWLFRTGYDGAAESDIADHDVAMGDVAVGDVAIGGDWLVYHHRDVRNNEAVGRVLDDCQFNLSVSRRLVPVDRLAVVVNTDVSVKATLQAAFWTPSGLVVAQGDLNQAGTTLLGFHDAVPLKRSESESLVLTAVTPVAIRLQNANGQVRLNNLAVERFVEYRLRPSDDTSVYPLRINDGDVFVVGDNVPVSDDSRVWGALSLDDVVGRVETVTSARTEPAGK